MSDIRDALAEATGEPVAVLYRVSTTGQDEDNQIPEVEAYCADRGYRIVRKFQLHARSASKGEQEPDLAAILADINDGRYKCVVVVHSSRLDRRDPDKQAFYALSVRMAGGRIESVREPDFGTPTLTGRLVTLLAQQQNHDYSVTLKGNLAAARARIKENGGFSGCPPWGYAPRGTKYSKKLAATALGAKYIPEIFRRIIAGESLQQVADWLTAEGVKPPNKTFKGKARTGWWAPTISIMIRNPVYKGQYSSRVPIEWDAHGKPVKYVYADVLSECPPLVDAVTWRKANDRLDQRPNRGPANGKTSAMLKGAVYCGNPDCTEGPDSPMYRRSVTRRSTYAYYRCCGRGPTRKGCGNNVRLDAVDKAVNEIIREDWDELEKCRKVVPGNRDEIENRLEEIQSEINRHALRKRDLPRAGEARREALEEYRRREDELEDLYAEVDATPRTDDQVEEAYGEKTYAELWEELELWERGPWLAANGFSVHITKKLVVVTQGDRSVETDL